MSDDNEQIETELNEWRGKLDMLKVKGNLLKMEFRDKKDDVLEALESALDTAKGTYEKVKDSDQAQAALGAAKAGAGHVKSAASAALAALHKAYHEHVDESADDENAEGSAS